MTGAILPVHTGWRWLDIVVYVISGGATVWCAWLLPSVIRSYIKAWREWFDLWWK